MQSGSADTKGDLRRAYVRVESGLTKRCQVLKESSNGEKLTVLIEDESQPTGVSSRHMWFEKSGDICESGCEVCFLFGNLLQCRYCGRQFHELCSCMPEAKMLGAISSPTFTCRDCFFMLYASSKGMEKGGCAKNSITFIKEVKKYRTYAYRELRWDVLHRHNRSGVYCYCGGPGHFSRGMLQCLRCLQWFHRACLHCLAPDRDVLPWDTYWFFKCAHCNGEFGEVCKQLPIVWPELLHLAIMNLCRRRNDFCDVKDDIMPWLTENWRRILPDKSVSLAYETVETIEEKLKSDPARFQCAQEVGGKAFQWRPRCSLAGPGRPDLQLQCSYEAPISQADLDEICFIRQISVASGFLHTLQSSAALPPPDKYKVIYGSLNNYNLMQRRLRMSHLPDYDESEMTLINEYRPDEDTSFGSAYRLAAAGSKKRHLNRPPPPKASKAKRRKIARKMRRRAGSSDRVKRANALWELDRMETSSPSMEFEEAATTTTAAAETAAETAEAVGEEKNTTLETKLPSAAAANSPETVEKDRARSLEPKEHEQMAEKSTKIRRTSGAEKKKVREEEVMEEEEEAEAIVQETRKTRSKLKNDSKNGDDSADGIIDGSFKEELQLDDEKIQVVKTNCDSHEAAPKTIPIVDKLPSEPIPPVNNILAKTKNLSRDSSIDSPLAVSSGGECDSRSAAEVPILRPRKRQVARKSVKERKRSPSPPQGPPSYRPSIRTRECSVALNNVHNWYEITGDQPPHSCASGSHVLRNIPSYTLASVDKNSTAPFAYRWEINYRPRVTRLKKLTKWPTRHSLGSTKIGKRTSLDAESGIATIFARRRPIQKQKKISDVELSSKEDAVIKVVSKGTLKKFELNCKTTVLPLMNMEANIDSDPNFEVLLNWNPKVLQMDALA